MDEEAEVVFDLAMLTFTKPTEYVEDDYAIVQSPDFATLFVLSRVQNVTDEKLAVSFVTWRFDLEKEERERKSKEYCADCCNHQFRPSSTVQLL